MASSSPGTPVNMTVLTGCLGELATKWMTIGIKLGQETCVRELKPVESMTPEDKCLSLLETWVESGEDVSFENLCSVLCSEGVNLEDIAKQIQVRLMEELSNYEIVH